LTALYALADVALVTPLIDGMNLVAKEYVAAQSEDDPGALVLSEFAGAAQELLTVAVRRRSGEFSSGGSGARGRGVERRRGRRGKGSRVW
jgi:hypothetical protein